MYVCLYIMYINIYIITYISFYFLLVLRYKENNIFKSELLLQMNDKYIKNRPSSSRTRARRATTTTYLPLNI